MLVKQLCEELGAESFKPMGNTIIIKRDINPDKSDGGIFFPETRFDLPSWATVVISPEEITTYDGQVKKTNLKEGDRIFLHPSDSQPLANGCSFHRTTVQQIKVVNGEAQKGWALVKIDVEEEKSIGGIILARSYDVVKRDPGEGTVTSSKIDGVKVGDRVVFIKGESNWYSEDTLVVADRHMMGVLEDDMRFYELSLMPDGTYEMGGV
jgi:co-chaperonin GroES (HSP10)